MIDAPPKVKIVLSSAGRGTVEVDGVAMNFITGLGIQVEARKSTRVTLTFPADVELVAAEAEVVARYGERPKDKDQNLGLPTASDVFQG